MGGEDLDIRIVEERATGRDMDLVDKVDLVAQQGGDDGGVVREVLQIDAVERRLSAPPAVERLVRRAHTGRVGGELEGPGPLRRLLEGPGLVVRRQDDRLVGGRAREEGEPSGRCVEVECDRVLVHLLHAVGREDALVGRERLRPAVGVGESLVRRYDVVGRHLLTGLELDALAKLVRPDGRGLVRLPARGQLGDERPRGRRPVEHLTGDVAGHEAPRIGIRVRVETVRGRRDAANAQTASGRAPLGRGKGKRCVSERLERRTDHGCRQAEHRRPPEELRAVELTVAELVEHGVLDRPGYGCAVLLETPTPFPVHCSPPDPVAFEPERRRALSPREASVLPADRPD